MTPSAESVLDDLRSAQRDLRSFLDEIGRGGPLGMDTRRPILFYRLDDPHLPGRLADHLPDEETLRSFRAGHVEAEKEVYVPIWLSMLGTDVGLAARMRSLVLGFVEESFPIKSRRLGPLRLNRGAMAALVIVYNLGCWEPPGRGQLWKHSLLRWTAKQKALAEDESIHLAFELLESVGVDDAGESDGELLFLQVLLEPLLAPYSQHWSQKPFWRMSAAEKEWNWIWNGLIARSPLTRLLHVDRFQGSASSEYDVRRESDAAEQVAESADDPRSLDWTGLDSLADRTDFDALSPMLQGFIEGMRRLEAAGTGPDPSRPGKLLRSVIAGLNLRHRDPRLPPRPTIDDLQATLTRI